MPTVQISKFSRSDANTIKQPIKEKVPKDLICKCDICGLDYKKYYEHNHINSKIHKAALNKIEQDKTPEEKQKEEEEEEEDENSDDNDIEEEEEDDEPDLNFDIDDDEDNELNDLDNENYKETEPDTNNEVENIFKKQMADLKLKKEQLKIDQMQKKIDNDEEKNRIKNYPERDEAEREFLINKFNEYKINFKAELIKLKLKKNITIDELKILINECEAVVNNSNFQQFFDSAVFGSLEMIEKPTKGHKIDINGLSKSLKNNREFMALLRQLYIKYRVFNYISLENKIIIILIIQTSTIIGINYQRNQIKNNYDDILNSEAYL